MQQLKGNFTYDVFISHAVEDKVGIANELCDALEKKGLTVWYSGKELSVGDSLIGRIEEGLAQSRFGVVILSPNYISKQWPLQEFYSLLSRHKNGPKVILPVLYQITIKELSTFHIVIADMIAIPGERGVAYVADRLVKEINSARQQSPISKKRGGHLGLWGAIIIIAVAALVTLTVVFRKEPISEQFVRDSIDKRIHELDRKADESFQKLLATIPAKRTTNLVVHENYARFLTLKSHYRNGFVLYTPGETIRARKGIEERLLVDLDTITPLNDYSLINPEIYYVRTSDKGNVVDCWIAVSTAKAASVIENSQIIDERYVVNVHYASQIRMVQGFASWPGGGQNTRHCTTIIFALPNSETFVFSRKHNHWILERVEENL